MNYNNDCIKNRATQISQLQGVYNAFGIFELCSLYILRRFALIEVFCFRIAPESHLEMVLLLVLLLLVPGGVVGIDSDIDSGDGQLECEEPLRKHYCVTKGLIAKDLPPQEPPLIVFLDLGVSVRSPCFHTLGPSRSKITPL